MSIKLRLILILFSTVLLFTIKYYYSAYHHQKQIAQKAIEDLNNVNAVFLEYKIESIKASEIDIQVQQELDNAKRENDDLRNQLRSGDIGVYINTTSTATETRSATTPCVANDAATRLDDANQQNFLDLKERAEQSKIMIEGLQSYIKQVCLKENQ